MNRVPPVERTLIFIFCAALAAAAALFLMWLASSHEFATDLKQADMLSHSVWAFG
jgi:hypothetical protein